MGSPVKHRTMAAHFSPRFAPVVLIRISHALAATGWPRLAKFAAFVNFFVFGIEVPSRLEIGPGLVLAHTQGTVLGGASIGSNATIFHQVTLGGRVADFGYDLKLRPVIEDDVTISTGAKILGAVTVGKGSTIGANAVVLSDVPPGSLAVGVPAKILTSAENTPE